MRIIRGPIYTFEDKELNRNWIRHLCLAEISSSKIKIDWEHTDYRWILSEEIGNHETIPGLSADLEKIRSL